MNVKELFPTSHKPYYSKPRLVTFKIWGRRVSIMAGSYWGKSLFLEGVKLAAEIDKPCSFDIPAADFGTPDVEIMRAKLYEIAVALIQKRQLYCGCAGGLGRTGVFLACLAKLTGESDPIGYIRMMYDKRAVETKRQEAYVESIKVWDLRIKLLFGLALRRYV